MRIDEVTVEMMRDFCGISDNSSDTLLAACMSAAKSYIMEQTALTENEIQKYPDLTIAYQVLCNEFFSKRDYTTPAARQSTTTNKCVDIIIAMHSKIHLN